jgi:hypothetical protein
MCQPEKGGAVMNRKWAKFHRLQSQSLKAARFCFPPTAPSGCPDIYPRKEKPVTPSILKADTLQYVALSDGIKRMYTNQDGLSGYGNTNILDPASVSYVNLFINAMLQPPSLYKVQEGILVLTSQDIPKQGVPIILQFIMIYQE